MAGQDNLTSDDELEKKGEFECHKFKKRSDCMKIFLESGCIPDAAMIHAARKRRQEARELGHDFIPVEEHSDEKGSRLVGEEDNDRSDDDDSQNRLNMNINTDALDKEKRRQAFLESQEIVTKETDEESEPDIEEWEVQQIRKGVTGGQLVTAHQDSMIQYNSNASRQSLIDSRLSMTIPNIIPTTPPPPIIQPPDPSRFISVTADEVLNKMRERLSDLREIHRRHEINYNLISQELEQTKIELKEGDDSAPDLAQRYKYYQELQGYTFDLVECFNEKLPQIAALESRWTDLFGHRATELIERRRQDTRDQAEELMIVERNLSSRRGPEDDVRIRRATEREGRRARRRRARELTSLSLKHIDGTSSDDEVTEQQNLVFRQMKDEIEKEAQQVFLDVEDDYCTIKGILEKFETWKMADIESYTIAYVSLCIPKIISPVIRLQLVTWNPIMESFELERSKWYNSLLVYALHSNETEESLQQDPDVRLIPLVFEKIVIPKLTTIIEKIWDPMSTSQTLRFVGLVNRLIREYPNLNENSKQLETLFNVILDKIQSSIENDVFIPIFSKQVIDPKNSFFQRQFSMAIKLLRNLLSWQGLVSDEKLKNVALGSLLNRYLLAGLRVSISTDALSKANIIMSTLPRAWLQGGTIDHLKMFATLIQRLSEQLDQADPAHIEAWEYSKSILKIIKPL